MTHATYTLDHDAITRDGRRMAMLDRASYGDGALSQSELDAFRNEVIATLNAAPDILAALKALLAATDGDIYTDAPEYADQVRRVSEAQETARSAIAMLEGEGAGA